MHNKDMEKKGWEEFRETGLLFLVNQILHSFGYAIVLKVDKEDKEIEAYPARVNFRGFTQENIDQGYEKIAKYLNDNSNQLYKEIMIKTNEL